MQKRMLTQNYDINGAWNLYTLARAGKSITIQEANKYYDAVVEASKNWTVEGTKPTDMEKAKQLMKEAGYEDTNDDGILEKDGTSLAIHFNYSQSLASVDNAVLSIAASLKELGFDVTIDAVDMNTWYGALMAGEYDLTFYNTAGGSFDLLDARRA